MQDLLDDEGCELEDEFSSGSSIVVADSFCIPNTTEFIIKKKYQKLFTLQRYQLLDRDGNNVLLQVDGPSLGLHKKRVMRDASGSLILTMRQKVNLLTLRHCWAVHRGPSRLDKDLIFRVQRCHPLEVKPHLDVFMPNPNQMEMVNHNCATFQLVKTYSDLSCRVYRGPTVIAEVRDGLATRNLLKYEERFRVKMNEGVDYAFILALFVIFTVNDYI